MYQIEAVDAPAIAEVAIERLRASPYKAMRRVSCKCEHGVLFLRGRLFSFHEKQVAQEAVAGVDGVTQVVNEIQVDDIRRFRDASAGLDAGCIESRRRSGEDAQPHAFSS